MKLRFEFDTAQTVPLYDKLLQQLLRHPQVLAVARTKQGYCLEAQGDQAQLSALADLIGEAIPLSCWLSDTRLVPIEEIGQHSGGLSDEHATLPYCRNCWQHPEGDCPVCGAQALVCDLPLDQQLDHWLTQLQQGHSIHYQAGANQLTVRLLSAHSPDKTESAPHSANVGLLFTDPAALNNALHINAEQIKLLGSIEKPRLLLEPTAEFCQQQGLSVGRYFVQQPHDRLTLALAESLKAIDIGVVAIAQTLPPLLLTQYGHSWAVLSDPKLPLPFASHATKQPHAQLLHVHASRDQQGFIQLRHSDNGQAPAAELAAAYALEGVRQRDRVAKRSAVWFLSQTAHSGLLFVGPEQRHHWWVRLPYADEPPLTPAAILAQIEQSSDNGARLIARYQQIDPAHLTFLRQRPQQSAAPSFSYFLALAAWFAGLSDSDDPQQASHQLLSLASQFVNGSAPRIDYGLERHNGDRLVQWQRALQACLSFRLADPDLKAALAFGVIDSFCDFLSHWSEQLDAEMGIDEVILAGDEFTNPVLLERLRLRLGKNIPLRLPPDFGPATLAIGALFVTEPPLPASALSEA